MSELLSWGRLQFAETGSQEYIRQRISRVGRVILLAVLSAIAFLTLNCLKDDILGVPSFTTEKQTALEESE